MDRNKQQISTLGYAIKYGVDNRLKDLHTAMPGIIESFDPELQTASVQPAIKRLFRTDEGDKQLIIPEALPKLINVPVQFPRGGGFSLTFPVKKGDECLLVFCERAIDGWHKFGDVRVPTAKRFHHIADATAFVGLSSEPNKIPSYNADDTELRNDEGDQRITLKQGKNIEIFTPTDVIIDCNNASITAVNDVDVSCTNSTVTASANADVTCADAILDASATFTVNCPASTFNGAVTVNGLLSFTAGMAGSGGGGASLSGISMTVTGGDVVADGISLKSHTHPQGADSAGNSQVNTGAPI